ncbi:hypothetical protein AVEN_81118-1 [Araneus ventricosus]|uniref:Uncharacterized protein n=1 Tax=Araneus ventricosus TaxID=182803 RepID=A0A4Y2TSS4_ARAVE|nr:hypothetical protein AVEN_81118-1 [Araneus ventricosus]
MESVVSVTGDRCGPNGKCSASHWGQMWSKRKERCQSPVTDMPLSVSDSTFTTVFKTGGSRLNVPSGGMCHRWLSLDCTIRRGVPPVALTLITIRQGVPPVTLT